MNLYLHFFHCRSMHLTAYFKVVIGRLGLILNLSFNSKGFIHHGRERTPMSSLLRVIYINNLALVIFFMSCKLTKTTLKLSIFPFYFIFWNLRTCTQEYLLPKRKRLERRNWPLDSWGSCRLISIIFETFLLLMQRRIKRWVELNTYVEDTRQIGLSNPWYTVWKLRFW